MRSTKLALACLALSVVVVTPAFAQEGHPLKGSWIGDWGPSKADRNPIFIVMDWDGKAVTGMINPGTDNIPLVNVRVTPPPPRPAGGRGGGGGGRGGGGGGRGGAAGAEGAAAPAAGGAQAGAAPAGGGGRGGRGGGAGAAAPAAGGAQAGAAPGGGQAPAPAAAAAPPPPQDWIIQFEANAKDRAGNAVRYVVEGKIENVGLYNRALVGSWSHGNVRGDFRIQRQ